MNGQTIITDLKQLRQREGKCVQHKFNLRPKLVWLELMAIPWRQQEGRERAWHFLFGGDQNFFFFKAVRRELHLLKREWAVRSTPLMMWKSPLLKRVTISVSRSGHFWGKSSLPMILMASLSCENAQDRGESLVVHLPPHLEIRPFKRAVTEGLYLFLNLFWAA